MTAMIQPATQKELEALLKDSRIRNIDEKTSVNHAIRSHAAKGPIIINMPNGHVYIAMDRKDDGYKNVALRGKSSGFGGNWNKKEFVCPEDLYVAEMNEELAVKEGDTKRLLFADLVKSGDARYFQLGEYFGVNPESAHGNPKIGLYLNPVSWFVTTARGDAVLDFFKIPKAQATKEKLHEAITAATEFKCSALFDLTDLASGRFENEKIFAWGDDRLLHDTVRTLYGWEPRIGMLAAEDGPNQVRMYRLTDVKLNQPYATRWTVPHDFLNPLRQGETKDAHVFTGGADKPKA
jgi:hypothetical protein